MSAMDDAYALVVGIADYRHVTTLPSAVRNDARDVRDLLVDHPEPFNPKKQVKIEPTVHKFPQPGSIGVMVTVNTATGLGTWFGSRIKNAIFNFYQDTVDPRGRDHIWTTPHGAKNLAKVHPTGGWGKILWPVNNVRKVTAGYTTCVTTNRVRVHANKRMPYTFTGTWNYPPTVAP